MKDVVPNRGIASALDKLALAATTDQSHMENLVENPQADGDKKDYGGLDKSNFRDKGDHGKARKRREK